MDRHCLEGLLGISEDRKLVSDRVDCSARMARLAKRVLYADNSLIRLPQRCMNSSKVGASLLNLFKHFSLQCSLLFGREAAVNSISAFNQ